MLGKAKANDLRPHSTLLFTLIEGHYRTLRLGKNKIESDGNKKPENSASGLFTKDLNLHRQRSVLGVSLRAL